MDSLFSFGARDNQFHYSLSIELEQMSTRGRRHCSVLPFLVDPVLNS